MFYKFLTIITDYFPNKTGNVLYVCHTEARSPNHFCRGTATSITYSECVFVALLIQNAKRMRRILLSSVAYLVLLYIFFRIAS
jgi:hypothetical protein